VIRGGSWIDSGAAFVCRSAYRVNSATGYSSFFFGFRVVLAPVLVP
jgi:formylglycine-generating enzyme required for sulfatase activity